MENGNVLNLGYHLNPNLPELEAPKFNEKINFEPLEDGANLIRPSENPDLELNQMTPTTYSDHARQIWEIFSPKSEIANQYGTSLLSGDEEEDKQLADDIQTLVGAFPEIQHGGARGALASKHVIDAYSRLNEKIVPSSWQVETGTKQITPRPNKDGDIQPVGLGHSLVWMFGMGDKFVTPKTLELKRLTQSIPMGGQRVANVLKKPGKRRNVPSDPIEPTRPIETFGEDISELEAHLGHLVAEQELDNQNEPQGDVVFTRDYDEIAPPEPSAESKKLIDSLSDSEIRDVTVEEAAEVLNAADLAYFEFIKQSLEAQHPDDE